MNQFSQLAVYLVEYRQPYLTPGIFLSIWADQTTKPEIIIEQRKYLKFVISASEVQMKRERKCNLLI